MRLGLAGFILLAFASGVRAQQANTFSGFFVSAFGQYTSGVSTQRDNGFVYTPPATPPVVKAPVVPPVVAPPPVFADGRYGLAGGFGGGGMGYNLPLGNGVVLGLIGDVGGGSAAGSSMSCGTPAHACGTRVDGVSDVRGHFGYAFGKVLLFGSVGLAVDHIRAYDALFGASGSAWRAGYVVGGGLEYKVGPHLSLAAEYLHTEIGSAHLFDIVPGTPERISFQGETARVSLNYYFSDPAPAPVIARY